MLSPKYIGLVFLLTIPLMGMKCSGAQYKVSGECSTGEVAPSGEKSAEPCHWLPRGISP